MINVVTNVATSSHQTKHRKSVIMPILFIFSPLTLLMNHATVIVLPRLMATAMGMQMVVISLMSLSRAINLPAYL